MLDPRITTRIRNYITAELRPRDRVFQESLQAESRRLGPTQGAMSGAAAHAHLELGRSELQVRAGLIWAAIRRSYSSLSGRDAPALLEDLQQQIAEYLTEEARIVAAYADDVWRGNERIFVMIRDSINIERRNELRQRFDIEAQFYVDSLKTPAPSAGHAHVMNFNGPVGAVQTGEYAVAHVSFSATDSQRLVEAIEALRRAIESNTEMSADQRASSLELSADVMAATRAKTPNSAKMRGLLNGLAQTVQTVASLQEAWGAVTDAATAMGAWFS